MISSDPDNTPHKNVNRAATRFLQVELQAFKDIVKQLSNKDILGFTPIRKGDKNQRKLLNFTAMYDSNKQLLRRLKEQSKAIKEPTLFKQLSYWVSSLQMENDELLKHLKY